MSSVPAQRFLQVQWEGARKQGFRKSFGQGVAIVVLDSVVDKLANLLANLVHILPTLKRLSTIHGIVSFQINEGIEMADAEIQLYRKLSDNQSL